MNKVILIGFVGNVNYKLLDTTTLTEFSLATKGKETEWHSVKGFGKLADLMNDYVEKGKQVMVEGRISYNEYTDKNGSKQKRAEVIATNFQVLGKKENNESFANEDIPF